VHASFSGWSCTPRPMLLPMPSHSTHTSPAQPSALRMHGTATSRKRSPGAFLERGVAAPGPANLDLCTWDSLTRAGLTGLVLSPSPSEPQFRQGSWVRTSAFWSSPPRKGKLALCTVLLGHLRCPWNIRILSLLTILVPSSPEAAMRVI
jgi:hypothetical protein